MDQFKCAHKLMLCHFYRIYIFATEKGQSCDSVQQDGPSLESSSYLNVSLRYLGPWDPGTLEPLDLGTLGPCDSWTYSLLQHLLILPLTSSYLLLSLPPTFLLWTFDLYIDPLGPPPSSNTSSYFPIHPLTSSYSPPFVWFG